MATKTAAQISAKIAALPVVRAQLQEQLEAAKGREVLVIGQSYPIYQGRGEGRTVVEAVLVNQRTTEEGGTEFAFQVPGEFIPVRLTARSLATDEAKDENGKKLPSSAAVAKKLASLADAEEVLEAQLAEALEREQLVINATYNIKVGRGADAKVVPAVLLGEFVESKSKTIVVDGVETVKTTEQKLLNFFYGSGADARTVQITAKSVVLSTEAEDAEAAAEAQADAVVTDNEEV